jgi:hypothetical protein
MVTLIQELLDNQIFEDRAGLQDACITTVLPQNSISL